MHYGVRAGRGTCGSTGCLAVGTLQRAARLRAGPAAGVLAVAAVVVEVELARMCGCSGVC